MLTFGFLEKYTLGQSGGSSTTITQAAVGKKKTAISQTRQLKLGYYRNPLSMPGLQPTEPMYSWGYSEGDCCGFSLRFSLLEENNRDKAFHLLHTKEKKRKNQSLGFFIVVKTSWKGALPPPPLPPRCLSCLCPYLLNQNQRPPHKARGSSVIQTWRFFELRIWIHSSIK